MKNGSNNEERHFQMAKQLRGVGDVLGTDPHKKMLKRSKKLAKKMGYGKTKKVKKEKEPFDYGGKMFSPEAWT